MGPAGQMFARNFQEEIAFISDQKYRDFVLRVADMICPAYFWEREASKSGYHPAFTNGVGGLVRHVKYACWWGKEICRALDSGDDGKQNSPSNDIVIAALLLHDCMKDGDPAKDHLKRSYKLISGCHGVDMAEAIWVRVLNKTLEFPEQALIIYGIAAHMGVWTKPEQYRPNNLKGAKARRIANLVHIADYNASRKIDAELPKFTAYQLR